MAKLQLTRITDVVADAVYWVWRPYIPAGKLTLLDGDPQLGKSLLTIDLAARFSKGRELPDGTAGVKHRTLFLQGEDAAADTVKPRLAAAGADTDMIFVVNRENKRPIRLPNCIRAIEEIVRAEKIDFVVIDPLVAYLPPRLAVSSDVAIRRVLAPLAAMAERTYSAVLLVRHLNKNEGQRAIYRGGGSIGMIGTVRSGLLVAADPKQAGRKLLLPLKSNLGPPPPALAYIIKSDPDGQAVIEWQGKSNLTADEVLRPAADDDAAPGMFLAADWLVKKLKSGPKLASKVIQEALTAGFTEHVLYRAKKEVHVESELKYSGNKREWIWKLYKPILPPLEDKY